MSSPPQAPLDAVTENRLMGGRVTLRQPARGYRAGLDAALLAAACDAGPGARVLEAGCGAGGVLMAAAVRCPGATFLGVERDPIAAALARENAALNGLSAQIEVLTGDVAAGFAALGHPVFDAVLANPPFFDDPNSLRAPSAEKTGAWLADDGLEAWTGFLLKAVREGGSLTMIHRADRLADLLSGLGVGAGAFQILPIHPFADATAKRVLVRARRTGKAPLRLLPPLILHARGGAEKHTAEAEAILRGEAHLKWL
ncbi:MAG: methyltransferase [Phenylobacterium sp.]|uniref:tRNA1(Val) (adenine(37)-N6)-methyltransferase n=1 Tax=Phenylobacterium sp. TaxID=1871053 RepID=UPI00271EB491|nr:methyltransferase [Phenylobacterium sp.]MDO8900954.1 methyltransferase [Phenylobacterium sp.]